MQLIKKLFQIIYSLYALSIFILLMFIVFVLVIIFLPFGKITSGNLIYKTCHIWARSWYFFVGIRHGEILEAPHNASNQYIFVSNHGSYMDIPAIVRSLWQPLRVLGKYEMVNYPVFGIIYRAAVIVVDRRDAEHRAQSMRALKAAVAKGISIFICPEGTFNMSNNPLKEFYDGAFRIAIETQTPIKPVLFIDAIDRLHWHSVFSLTPGKNRVVFLEEIKVIDFSFEDTERLKKKVYEIMENGLKRYRNYEHDKPSVIIK